MKGKTSFIGEALTGVTILACFVLPVIINIQYPVNNPIIIIYLAKFSFFVRHNYRHLNISNINCHEKKIELIQEEEKEEVGYDAIHYILNFTSEFHLKRYEILLLDM